MKTKTIRYTSHLGYHPTFILVCIDFSVGQYETQEFTSFDANMHFSVLRHMFVLLRASKTSSKSLMCWSHEFNFTTMSST